jgi:hypothetical protein
MLPNPAIRSGAFPHVPICIVRLSLPAGRSANSCEPEFQSQACSEHWSHRSWHKRAGAANDAIPDAPTTICNAWHRTWT